MRVDVRGARGRRGRRPVVTAAGRGGRAPLEELGTGSAVLLADTSSPVERAVIQDWFATVAREGDAGLEMCPVAGHELVARLEAGDEPLLVPVRVVWLPPDSGGASRSRALLRWVGRRRPGARAQARILRREPDRCRIVVGEGAGVADLRERRRTASADADGAEAFAVFVSRQATLALDRAERSLLGERYKRPRFVAETLSGEPHFREGIAELSGRLGTPERDLRERATEYLGEIAATQNQFVIDLFSEAVKPTFANAWTLRADTETLEALRELNREHALVFLPSHRSYADSWLLASILRDADFPRNHTLGGANMNFWPLGPVMRRCGYVLVRRSFRDDELYKLVVREYLGYLVSKRFNLEWYIEGGRSRTGKLRPPRLGLMRYLVDAVESGRARDVYLVPVSINYDQLAEVGQLAAEEHGKAKKAENALWFARFIRGQQQNVGEAQVRFAKPLSLREAMRDGGPDPKLAMEKVAFEVCDRINGATPVTTTALVTIALLDSPGRALTLGEVREVLAPLLGYVDRRGLRDEPLDSLQTASGVRVTLDALRRSGVVTSYDEGLEPVYRIIPGRHQVAAYARNTAIHWFVNRAIVELTVLATTRGERTDDDPLTTALELRDLLKYEFFFPRKRSFRDELVAELELLDPHWQGADPEAARKLLAASGMLLAPRVLRPFLESYLITAQRLAAHEAVRPVDEQALLAECAAVAQQYVLQGRLHSPEAVSRDAFANAVKLAGNRGLLDAGRRDLVAARQAFADEIATVIGWIDDVEDIRVEKMTVEESS